MSSEYIDQYYLHHGVSSGGGSQLPASRFGSFTTGERASVMHWIGGWMGPRAGLILPAFEILDSIFGYCFIIPTGAATIFSGMGGEDGRNTYLQIH